MAISDLFTAEPDLFLVKGVNIGFEEMGRMIDPYLPKYKNEKGKCCCFYKQNGVSMPYSYDFKNRTYSGHTESGENACVLLEENDYLLFHSPKTARAKAD